MKCQIESNNIYIHYLRRLHTHINKTITLITRISENFIQFSYEL